MIQKVTVLERCVLWSDVPWNVAYCDVLLAYPGSGRGCWTDRNHSLLLREAKWHFGFCRNRHFCWSRTGRLVTIILLNTLMTSMWSALSDGRISPFRSRFSHVSNSPLPFHTFKPWSEQLCNNEEVTSGICDTADLFVDSGFLHHKRCPRLRVAIIKTLWCALPTLYRFLYQTRFQPKDALRIKN